MTDIAEGEEGSKSDIDQSENGDSNTNDQESNQRREGVLVMRPRNVLKENNNDSGFDEKD